MRGFIMKKILRRPAIKIAVLAFPPATGALADELVVPAPFGAFEVVALRNASDVASTSASMDTQQQWMGTTANFTEGEPVWFTGETCAIWSIREVGSADVMLSDPNLSDAVIPPLDSGASSGDRRVNLDVELVCNDLGEQIIARFAMVDRRILIVPSPSGAQNLILEKPLSNEEIIQFQIQLMDMKFYDGEISGSLTAKAITSIGFYAEYRGSEFRFHRPVISENLLDGLGILAGE